MAVAMISAIVAGVSLLSSKAQDNKANSADKRADILAGYNDEIKTQMALSDASINAYNMTTDFSNQMSANQAMSAGMGKSTTGGSAQAIDAYGAETLSRDIEQGFEKAELTGAMNELARGARDNSTNAKNSARKSKTRTQGLLTASKLFA